HERLAQMKERNAHHLYVVSVDDGTERRTENFVERAFPHLSEEEVYRLIVYFDKDRFSYGSASTGIKPFSQITEHNIDPKGIYIIIDDMFASGGTGKRAAKRLKEKNAKRVEGWMSHAVTMPPQHIQGNDRQYLDAVVCLDTVPQHPDLQVEFISASANLLAAELYKTHQRLVASR
ncbi:MAG: hypothetical protein AABX37_00470, partial [Nanoarchaeota archaeon]